MSDTPTIHAVLSQIETAASPEPFTLALSDNRRIAFPDPGDMRWEEAEQLLVDLSTPGRGRMVFRRWLSEADYDALMSEAITLKQMTALMDKLQAHYSAIFGQPGESPASPS